MTERTALLGKWKMLSWKRESIETGEQTDALGPVPVGSRGGT